MAYCSECGAEADSGENFCGECGADLTNGEGASDASFVDQYGSKPLPLASARGEFIRIYGKLMGAIPLFGGLVKLFVGFGFWCYSIWLKILKIITLGASVTNRFVADYNYIKDSFYSGYNGEKAPPKPP